MFYLARHVCEQPVAGIRRIRVNLENGRRGLEQPALSPRKTPILQNGGAKSGAVKDEIDSNLTWLAQHWPSLPASIRERIITTARDALKSERKGND